MKTDNVYSSYKRDKYMKKACNGRIALIFMCLVINIYNFVLVNSIDKNSLHYRLKFFNLFNKSPWEYM